MGINDYSDLSWEEFKALRLMAPQKCQATHNLRVKATRQLSIPS